MSLIKSRQEWFVVQDKNGWLIPDTSFAFSSACKEKAEEKYRRPWEELVAKRGFKCVKITAVVKQ